MNKEDNTLFKNLKVEYIPKDINKNDGLDIPTIDYVYEDGPISSLEEVVIVYKNKSIKVRAVEEWDGPDFILEIKYPNGQSNRISLSETKNLRNENDVLKQRINELMEEENNK